MTKVRVADRAARFGAHHAKCLILMVVHRRFPNGLPVAWPTGAGVKFMLRAKQWCLTTGATIDPGHLFVPVFSAKRPLGASLSSDPKYFRIQQQLPFFIAFLYSFVFHIHVKR